MIIEELYCDACGTVDSREVLEHIRTIVEDSIIRDSELEVCNRAIDLALKIIDDYGLLKTRLEIAEQTIKQSEWVSLDDESIDVTDRYPNEEDRVICVNKNGSTFFAYYDDYEGEFLLSFDAKTKLKDIVAWREDVEPYK